MDDRRREDPGTRLGSWKSLIPLTVAAAAALFIAGSVDVVHRHQRAAKEEHDAKPAAKAEQTDPRFAVGITTAGTALVVRDVHTGADVGLPVAPPQDRRFHRVAAAKDGSYIVASYGAGKVTFQRLHLGDDGRPQDLKDIPKATVPGVSNAGSDIAVAGDHLAYVTYKGKRGSVDVLTLSTGARKTWTTKVPGRVDSLSWSGATLSFVWSPVGSAKRQLRTIDTNTAAGDLKLSKAVMTLPKGGSSAVLSRDGKQVVVGTVAKSQLTLQTFTLTGKPAKVLWRQKVTGPLTDLDAAHSGGTVLATAGDLYANGLPPVPGKDLADAAW
ncbi:hypothetical protein [Actinomadura latina]|uniref:WD40 repeat domain-containing protein n=1 Tax=Actinomadura latina TaxID=163603 RepID=A0A846YPR4_9ACTN|nr:hypothetical protein [Actinomadura latina]NKZ02760.1 hypothetical protein [Actinomadura latina]